MYKVYYWLTLLLFLLMFVMAAWFVCLVAVNTTGELSETKYQVSPMLFEGRDIRAVGLRTPQHSPDACCTSLPHV